MCIARENLVNEKREMNRKQTQPSGSFVPNNWKEIHFNDAMVSRSRRILLWFERQITNRQHVFRFFFHSHSQRNASMGLANWCPKQRSIWTNIGTNSKRFWRQPAKISRWCPVRTMTLLPHKKSSTLHGIVRRPPTHWLQPNWICSRRCANSRPTMCTTNWTHWLARVLKAATTTNGIWTIQRHRTNHSPPMNCTTGSIWMRCWCRTSRLPVASTKIAWNDARAIWRWTLPNASNGSWPNVRNRFMRCRVTINSAIATSNWRQKIIRIWRTKQWRYAKSIAIMTLVSKRNISKQFSILVFRVNSNSNHDLLVPIALI